MKMMILFVFMFFTGLMTFSLKRNNLLLMLLSLEFIMLSLYLMIFMYLSFMGYSYFFSMLFLSFSVCEGSLGLSILVSMTRLYGNDYMMSISSLW
uniref:NADH-ubiquinone oxidoreductase chain 4L n=1 Tax=Erotylidae sp. BMNH 1274391 TaxID=1796503 RepID=A0A126TE65_9CUCU|nr:NADH dehydrogenase subunit 4 [Erotylidae sp. BMNH 1274391]